jgi:uncharacterized protein Gcw-chp
LGATEAAGAHLRRLAVAAGALAVLATSLPAQAQIAGSASVVSDYRLRAASVSGERPAVSLTVSDDLANGVYFGATVVGGKPSGAESQILGHIEFLGYAHRLANGLTWEVGADNVDFSLYPEPNFHLSYSEAYAGISNGTISSRLYLSPNYLKQGLTVAYLELNGVARPADDWRLSGHVGVFQPLSGNSGTTVRRARTDVRLEVIRKLGPTEINVGWTSAFPAAFPTPWRTGSTFLAGVTAYF